MSTTRRPRVLLVNEASFLATGYSTYGMEVLKRLHETGKYELGELACYARGNDPRGRNLPWKFYGNIPPEGDTALEHRYNSDPINQFGQWAFNEVCLDFKPDIVWDIRDWWMLEFAERSPFRRFYHWCIMPTVDAMPQHEQWLSTYINADTVHCYSDWGVKTLRREGGGLINVKGTAPPGADLETFAAMVKPQVRKAFQLDPDAFIVGTVMRNQPRKLYPQLIDDFKLFLSRADSALAKRSFLYMHTSYPDNGWDIPDLIKKSGIGHKILLTYKCRTCSCVFPSFYQDAKTCCPKCKGDQAGLPTVRVAVDRETLALIINLFDIYVQYSNSEGFGMPQVEAAACGVPVIAPYYSAMQDVVDTIHGFPLKNLTYRKEPETGCYRCSPSGEEFAQTLIRFAGLGQGDRTDRSYKARKAVERHYTWEKTTAEWEKTFDSLPLKPLSETWESPETFLPRVKPPDFFRSNEEMVRWCILHILDRPDLANSYMALRMIRDMNWGVSMAGTGATYRNEDTMLGMKDNLKKFDENDMLQAIEDMRKEHNLWEERRCQK